MPSADFLSSLVWTGPGSSTDSAESGVSPARKAKTSASPAPPATSETSPMVPEETPETPVSASPWAGRTPGLSERDRERIVAARLLQMLRDLGQVDEAGHLIPNAPEIPPMPLVMAKAACKPPAAPPREPEPELRGEVVTVDSSSGDSGSTTSCAPLPSGSWDDSSVKEMDATGGDF